MWDVVCCRIFEDSLLKWEVLGSTVCSGWFSYMLDLFPLWWVRHYLDMKIPRFCNFFFPIDLMLLLWMQICYKKSKGQWRTCLKWLSEFIISSYYYYNWISTFLFFSSPLLECIHGQTFTCFLHHIVAAAVPLHIKWIAFPLHFLQSSCSEHCYYVWGWRGCFCSFCIFSQF